MRTVLATADSIAFRERSRGDSGRVLRRKRGVRPDYFAVAPVVLGTMGRWRESIDSVSIRRRIAAVRGIADDLLERSTHRHVQVDVLRRDRLHEPLVVDRVDLAALVDGDHRTVDDLLEARVVA